MALLLPASTLAGDATIPGTLSTPYPTLINISVEWEIQGDDDLDGAVSVEYRPLGAPEWRPGLPLMRVPAGSNWGFSWSNKHSGSIFDLEPGTTYEIRLSLVDPDGGSETRTVSVATRPVPRAAPDGTLRTANPSTFPTIASSAQPGDIIELGPGDYDGFIFGRDGTLSEPIVIRAATRGTVVIHGDVRLDGRIHVFLEDLEVRGKIKFNDSEGIVVRGCRVETTESGIVGTGNGTVNAYIADNVVIGPTGWAPSTVGSKGNNRGEGIQVTGPGNVICYNYVKGFRDAISTMEDSFAHNQVSIDIYNNDIEIGADDAIEADFMMGNGRIMRNRITNSNTGLSSQPSLGGPTYFIRNVMYNLSYVPFKLHRFSIGDVALHNTSVKCGDAFAVYTTDTWSQAWFRNNLFIGGDGDSSCRGNGDAAALLNPDETCEFDYDGYGTIGMPQLSGRIGNDRFSDLDELRSNTTERHAVEVDMTIFAEAVDYPGSGPFPLREIPDLAVHPTSNVVDRGQPLPNINEGFAGHAPDIGAYEAGSEPPHYGPRADPGGGGGNGPVVPDPPQRLRIVTD